MKLIRDQVWYRVTQHVNVQVGDLIDHHVCVQVEESIADQIWWYLEVQVWWRIEAYVRRYAKERAS